MTTKTDRANAKLMQDAGYDFEQIGAFYGVKADTVRGWVDPAFKASQAKKFALRNFKKSKGWS